MNNFELNKVPKIESGFKTPDHYFDTFSERLNKFRIKIVLLNRFTEKDNKKNNIINRIKSGEYNIIIGTHRLLSKNISFDNMAFGTFDLC